MPFLEMEIYCYYDFKIYFHQANKVSKFCVSNTPCSIKTDFFTIERELKWKGKILIAFYGLI